MKNIVPIELKKENKKAALCCFGLRVSFNANNVRSVDLWYTREMLQKVYGRTVDVVSQRTRDDVDRDYYKNIQDTDLNDYDEVWVYASMPNIYGGVIHDFCLSLIERLSTFKGDVYCILLDPKIPALNFAKYIWWKIGRKVLKNDNDPYGRITQDIVDNFTKKWNNVKIAFGGFDYNIFYNMYTEILNNSKHNHDFKYLPLNERGEYEWFHFPLFEYYAKHERLEQKLTDYDFASRTYDCVYYGNDRGTSRNNKLKKYYDVAGLNVLLIGFDYKRFKNNTHDAYEKYVKHEELFPMMCTKAFATVIMGDELHDDNYMTPRYFESMLLDVVAFIDISFDKERKFIKNKELADFIYVSSGEELKQKINIIKNDEAYFRKIVALQRAEILNMLTDF